MSIYKIDQQVYFDTPSVSPNVKKETPVNYGPIKTVIKKLHVGVTKKTKSVILTDTESEIIKEKIETLSKETLRKYYENSIKLNKDLSELDTENNMDKSILSSYGDMYISSSRSAILNEHLEGLIKIYIDELLKYNVSSKKTQTESDEKYSELNINVNNKYIDKALLENSSVYTRLEAPLTKRCFITKYKTYLDTELKHDKKSYNKLIDRLNLLFMKEEVDQNEKQLTDRLSLQQYSQLKTITSLFKDLMNNCSDLSLIKKIVSSTIKDQSVYGGNFLYSSNGYIIDPVIEEEKEKKKLETELLKSKVDVPDNSLEEESTSEDTMDKIASAVKTEEEPTETVSLVEQQRFHIDDILEKKVDPEFNISYSIPFNSSSTSYDILLDERTVAYVCSVVMLHSYDEKYYKHLKEYVNKLKKSLTESIKAFFLKENSIKLKSTNVITQSREKDYMFNEFSKLENCFEDYIESQKFPESVLYFINMYKTEKGKKYIKNCFKNASFNKEQFEKDWEQEKFTQANKHITVYIEELVSNLLKEDLYNLNVTETLWKMSYNMVSSPELLNILTVPSYGIDHFISELSTMLSKYRNYFEEKVLDTSLEYLAGRSTDSDPIHFDELFLVSKLPIPKNKDDEKTIPICKLIRDLYAKSIKSFRATIDKKVPSAITKQSLCSLLTEIVRFLTIVNSDSAKQVNYEIFSKIKYGVSNKSGDSNNCFIVLDSHESRSLDNRAPSEVLKTPDLYSKYYDIIEFGLQDRFKNKIISKYFPLLAKSVTYHNSIRNGVIELNKNEIPSFSKFKDEIKKTGCRSAGSKQIITALSHIAIEIARHYTTFLFDLNCIITKGLDIESYTTTKVSDYSPNYDVCLLLKEQASIVKNYIETNSCIKKIMFISSILKFIKNREIRDDPEKSKTLSITDLKKAQGKTKGESERTEERNRKALGDRMSSPNFKYASTVVREIDEKFDSIVKTKEEELAKRFSNDMLSSFVYKFNIVYTEDDLSIVKFLINSCLTSVFDRATIIALKDNKEGKQISVDDRALDLSLITFS